MAIFESKYGIKNKIARLKEFAHTFSFELEDGDTTLPYKKCFISITEHDQNSHFIYLLNYKQEKNNFIDEITYKEQSLKVDRLYYLEIANATIDNKKRLELVLGMVGKRRFGANNQALSLFLNNKNVTLDSVYDKIRAWENNPLKNDKNTIVYERNDKNINYFEALVVNETVGNYAFLRQKNISKESCVRKSFLVELENTGYDFFSNTMRDSQKIDAIFTEMGRIYFSQLPPQYSRIQENLENIEDHIQSIGAKEEKNTLAFAALLELSEKKKFDPEKLRLFYFDVYKKALNFIKEPKDENLAIRLAESIAHYKALLKDFEVFDEIVSLLVSMMVLLEDGDFGILTGNDNSFKEIVIATVESIGVWQNDIFVADNKSLDTIGASMIDFTENLKYLITSFDERKTRIFEDSETNCKASDDTVFFNIHHLDTQNPKSTYSNDKKISSIERNSLEQIETLESEILDIFYAKDTLDAAFMRKLYLYFATYHQVLNTIYEYKELGYALSSMVSKIEKTALENLDALARADLYDYAKLLTNELRSFRNAVLSGECMENLHRFDAKLMNCIQQIDTLLAD